MKGLPQERACPKSGHVPRILKGMSQERACPKHFKGHVPRAGLSQVLLLLLFLLLLLLSLLLSFLLFLRRLFSPANQNESTETDVVNEGNGEMEKQQH